MFRFSMTLPSEAADQERMGKRTFLAWGMVEPAKSSAGIAIKNELNVETRDEPAGEQPAIPMFRSVQPTSYRITEYSA
jgi:hypothetical protein